MTLEIFVPYSIAMCSILITLGVLLFNIEEKNRNIDASNLKGEHKGSKIVLLFNSYTIESRFIFEAFDGTKEKIPELHYYLNQYINVIQNHFNEIIIDFNSEISTILIRRMHKAIITKSLITSIQKNDLSKEEYFKAIQSIKTNLNEISRDVYK